MNVEKEDANNKFPTSLKLLLHLFNHHSSIALEQARYCLKEKYHPTRHSPSSLIQDGNGIASAIATVLVLILNGTF